MSVEERIRIYEFVNDWLFSSEKRQTSGVSWPREYVNDTVTMIQDYINHIKEVTK